MTIRLIERDGAIVRYAEDDLPPPGGRVSALVSGRAIDELTGLAPRGEIIVSSQTPGTPRVAGGGIVGLAGIPREAFPDLRDNDYRVALTIAAEGFIPRTVTVEVPVDPRFPDHFDPPVIEEVELHRQPVVIEGRVVRAVSGATTPLAGASVQVTGVWRRPPSATVVVLADPPNLVALEPPLQIARDTAGTVAPLPLAPVPGDALRTLLLDVPAGATRLRVSNAQGVVVPGTRVAIDAGDADRVEFAEVVLLEAATTPEQPAWLTLRLPLAGPHRTGAPVIRMVAGAAGVARAIDRDGLSGDPVLFLADLAGLDSGNTVVVADATAENEYHRVRLFDVTTDAEGYYRLPPLSRVAQLTVRAGFGTLTPITVELRPNYTQPSHRLDFVLS